jgi:hypothetical protein
MRRSNVARYEQKKRKDFAASAGLSNLTPPYNRKQKKSRNAEFGYWRGTLLHMYAVVSRNATAGEKRQADIDR